MSDDEKFTIPEDLEEWIGLRKSEYLSVLIENMGEGDFGFEEFHLFDHRIQGTVDSPDRSFEETRDGNIVRTFIRTYSDKKMYHQVVVGAVYQDRKNKSEVLLPIITFVTRSEGVVAKFSVGNPVTRPTLN